MILYRIECLNNCIYYLKRRDTGEKILWPNIGFFYFLPRFTKRLLEDECAACVEFDGKMPLENELFLRVVIDLANDRFRKD
ncbi:MAG: hypothetical protein ABIH25_04470 [Candidatus Woesearchaeota archaeon]